MAVPYHIHDGRKIYYIRVRRISWFKVLYRCPVAGCGHQLEVDD